MVGGTLVRTVIEEGETFFPSEPTTTAERLDPATASWSRIEGIGSHEGVPTTALMPDGRVLVVTDTHAAIYDPAAGTWQDTTAIPGGRHDASAVVLSDGSVLVGGGWSKWPDRESAPSCPAANPQLWRFVPGA